MLCSYCKLLQVIVKFRFTKIWYLCTKIPPVLGMSNFMAAQTSDQTGFLHFSFLFHVHFYDYTNSITIQNLQIQ